MSKRFEGMEPDTNIVRRNRKLENEDDVFTQNAWDETEWTSTMLREAQIRVEQQKKEANTSANRLQDIELEVSDKWDRFYSHYGDKFFKDRKWIFSEFPEILERLRDGSQSCRILEVGCGVGNAIAHVIASNQNPNLHVYCCDLSPRAIETLKCREFYIQNSDKITAFPANICTEYESNLKEKISSDTIDFITIIFTLSALKPELMKTTVKNLTALLKPGGMMIFRDYARYDLTQLRFKSKAYLSIDYYVRSDGTTSYFFTKDFLHDIFTSAGLIKLELKEDNRMLVNRSKCLKMCRGWIQAKYMRPL